MLRGPLVPSCGRGRSGTRIAVWSNRSNSCGLGREGGTLGESSYEGGFVAAGGELMEVLEC